jgi:Arc/MetJ-type ribon-helix-helix transcriptional regulator
MKSVSLKLPDDLHAKLAQVSRKRSAGKSEVIRAALEAYFASAQHGAEPSCADLASDLIGAVAGPKDLATHPKHLRGYGR